jgi:flagellar hook-associated protein 1 FlgK
MRTAFFGLHVASSGLHTARAALNVTSHNVANAEIPGFTRQVAQMRAGRPLTMNDGRGMYGTGSQVTSVIQIRDRFLDRKYWGQNSIYGQFASVNTHLGFVETVFNQLPNVGVKRTFNGFFSTLQDLTTRAHEPTFRTNVATNAHSLTEQVRQNAFALQRQQLDLNREFSDVITTINSLGQQISDLNRQIHIFERDGSNANDLRDQRALLIDELSGLVNVQVDERDFSRPGMENDRRLTVMINGYDFVDHTRFNRLALVARDNIHDERSGVRQNEMDVAGLYDVFFEATGSRFNIHSQTLSGKLRGIVDVRDGNGGQVTVTGSPSDGITSNFKGIPFYMNQLNHLIRTFARAMNEGRNTNGDQIPGAIGHIFGFDANGNNRNALFFTFEHPLTGNPGLVTDSANPALSLRRWIMGDASGNPLRDAAGNFILSDAIDPPATVARDSTGNPLFTIDYSQFNALNFIVNPELITDPSLLAASSNHNVGQANNDVIHGFLAVGNDKSLFREGRLIDFIIATSNHLAVDNAQAGMFRESYHEITMQTHNHRLSVSSVDTEEEMLNLVRFQNMFIATSKLINVIDTVYDTLINRLGNF